MDALGELVPHLRLPRVVLGDWPSPLDRVTVGGLSFLAKREDLSSASYAGNKVRPLERVFGEACDRGATTVWATGAYGSNHALATAVHASAAGLRAGAVLWPQPVSITARDNLRATVATASDLAFCPNVAAMPLVALARRGPRALVMTPGAATPRFALGHAAGALELALQLAEAGHGPPATLVLPVGSTCTTVGLLVGCALARHLGLWASAPHLVAVRVTPWPVTSPWRIVRMACAAADTLARLGGPRLGVTPESFSQHLTVMGDALGRGYGHPTEAAWRAGAALLDATTTVTRLHPRPDPDTRQATASPPLRTDTTYAGKAAGWLLARLPDLTRRGEVVFWMTKSARPLPAPDLAREATLPPPVQAWLRWPLGLAR